jgi:hypothetical protein
MALGESSSMKASTLVRRSAIRKEQHHDNHEI